MWLGQSEENATVFPASPEKECMRTSERVRERKRARKREREEGRGRVREKEKRRGNEGERTRPLLKDLERLAEQEREPNRPPPSSERGARWCSATGS